MTVKDAIHIFQISQKNLHRKKTTDSYRYLLEHLEKYFPDTHLEAIIPDQIYQFLEALMEHMAGPMISVRSDAFYGCSI